MKNFQDITYIIKTFERKECCDRLVNSIYNYFENTILKEQILVCNDGSKEYFNNKCICFNTKYDIGLSAGRNLLVENVKTKYFILLDDDFVFDNNINIPNLYNTIIETNYDIISGSVSDRVGFKGGYFIQKDYDVSVIETHKKFDENTKVYDFDIVINFFIANTDSFKKNNIKWDENLKVGEHTLFFYNIWKNNKGLKIGFKEGSIVDHKQQQNQNYIKLRYRDKDIESRNLHRYHIKTLRHWGRVDKATFDFQV